VTLLLSHGVQWQVVCHCHRIHLLAGQGSEKYSQMVKEKESIYETQTQLRLMIGIVVIACGLSIGLHPMEAPGY
jgi:hypothetical protein